MTQEEFAGWIGVDYTRYRNIDICRARLTDDLFEQLWQAIPEFFLWVAAAQAPDIAALKRHRDHRFVSAAVKLEMGQCPDIFLPCLQQLANGDDQAS